MNYYWNNIEFHLSIHIHLSTYVFVYDHHLFTVFINHSNDVQNV